MLTLEAVKESTNEIFDGFSVMVPEPDILWKDRIQALEEANLGSHRTSCIFDMRRDQAAKLGFEQLHSSELVEMLMGEPHTESKDGPTRHYYEWAYNHHKDEQLNETWGAKPEIFIRTEKKGLWYYPPFSKIKKWECQFGKLNYLKRDIPYGVILRINECKKLKLFNVFNVLAPMEAWERKTDIDPIVVASIWELPLDKEGNSTTAGQVAHYFLAQW